MLKIRSVGGVYKLAWASHYGRNGHSQLTHILRKGIPAKVIALFTGAETDDEKLNDLIKFTRYDDGFFFSRLLYFYGSRDMGEAIDFFDGFFIED